MRQPGFAVFSQNFIDASKACNKRTHRPRLMPMGSAFFFFMVQLKCSALSLGQANCQTHRSNDTAKSTAWQRRAAPAAGSVLHRHRKQKIRQGHHSLSSIRNKSVFKFFSRGFSRFHKFSGYAVLIPKGDALDGKRSTKHPFSTQLECDFMKQRILCTAA